jgi:hypothetical protein
MSVSPPSGSASAVWMQLRTLCLSPGLRLSDCVEPDANCFGRPRAIDFGPQRPTYATSFHGPIQAVAARVQVDPTTRLSLRRIHHADPVANDDSQQLGFVLAPAASRAHADRRGHLTQVTRASVPPTFRTECATTSADQACWAAFRTEWATTCGARLSTDVPRPGGPTPGGSFTIGAWPHLHPTCLP